MTIIHKLQVRWSISTRKLLRAFFKFDKWHISPFVSRNYAKAIVQFVNNCGKRNGIVEIGCGLADILRHADFKNKYGYDADIRVLKAARVLTFFQGDRSKYYFKKFVFPSFLKGCYDVILLVNWIHHIEPVTLKSFLCKYFESNLQKDGLIVLDTVADPTYEYNHDIKFLTDSLSCLLFCIGTYENERKVWAIKKI